MVAKANKPIAASLPCLNEQAQRELLAGFELELGDQKAQTIKAENRAASAEVGTLRTGLLAGLIGALLGFVLGGIVVSVSH